MILILTCAQKKTIVSGIWYLTHKFRIKISEDYRRILEILTSFYWRNSDKLYLESEEVCLKYP